MQIGGDVLVQPLDGLIEIAMLQPQLRQALDDACLFGGIGQSTHARQLSTAAGRAVRAPPGCASVAVDVGGGVGGLLGLG